MARGLLGSSSLTGAGLLGLLLAAGPQPLHADDLPQNPTVTNGAADFDYSQTNHLHVAQQTRAVRIEWDSFNIGAGKTTEFHQPDAGSIAFNIVKGRAPSTIFGTLKANGQVVLSNGNGILFTKGSILDVAGAVLTTHDPVFTVDTALGPDPFLDADIDVEAIGADGQVVAISTGDGSADDGGRRDKRHTLLVLPPSLSLRFTRPAQAAATPSVDFRGEARIADQGGIGIVAPIVRVPGKIVARGGVVALSTADSFTIDPYGDGLITFEIGSIEHKDRGEIDHAGVTVAQTVLLDVGHMNTILDRTINISGVVAAQSASVAADGTVVLGGGDVTVDGVVKGDDVDIDAGTIEIAGLIDATGADQIMLPDGAAGEALADIQAQIATANQILAGGGAGGRATAGKVRLAAAHSIDITGGITAAGGLAGQTGGSITAVAGTDLTVAGGAVVTADGQAGGGDILLTGDRTVAAAGGAVITASAGVTGDGGRIRIGSATGSADDSDAGGLTEVAATVAADGAADGVGGTVEILGAKVGVVGAAVVTARGGAGGGSIHVGGDYQGRGTTPTATVTFVGDGTLLDASAVGPDSLGDGGEVIVWADHTTRAFGTIRATAGLQGGDGGFVEVSGKQHLAFAATVDTSAAAGANGTLLLDPNNITIKDNSGGPDTDSSGDDNEFITVSGATRYDTSNDGSILDISLLHAALASNDVHVLTGTAGGNSEAGNIYVNVKIENTGPNALTLEAHNNIEINADIDFGAGTGALTLIADGNGADGAGALIHNAGMITMGGGALTLAAGSGIGAAGKALTVVLNADTTLDATTATGGIFVTGTGSGRLDIAKASVTNAGDGNNIDISNNSRITVSGLVEHKGSGNIILSSSDDITQTGQIHGGAAVDLTATGDLVLNAKITAATALTLTSGGSLTQTAAIDGGTGPVALSASGPILVTGDITTSGTVSAITRNNTPSAITLTGTGNNVGSLTVETLDAAGSAAVAGAITVTEAAALDLASVRTAGNASFTAAGAITDSAALSVGGTAVFASTVANADITIDGTGGSFGSIAEARFSTLGTTGDVTFKNAAAAGTVIGASTVNGNLVVESHSGSLTDSGVLAVTGTADFVTTTANADITIDGTGGSFASIAEARFSTLGTAGDVTFKNAAAAGTVIGASTVNGNLVVESHSGSLTDSGVLAVTGTADFVTTTANADITIDGTGGSFASIAEARFSTLGTTGDVTFKNAAAAGTVIGASTVNGNLVVESHSGSLTDSGVLAVTGTADFVTTTANANITIDGTGGSFASIAEARFSTLGTGGDVTFKNAAAAGTVIGASTVNGNLVVESHNGALTDSGVLAVTGTADFVTTTANADITIDGTGGSFASIAEARFSTLGTGGDVTFKNAAAAGTVIGASTVNGNLVVESHNGALTDSGVLAVTGTADFATKTAGADITIDGTGAGSQLAGAISATTTGSAGDVTIINDAAGGTVLGASLIQGGLSVDNVRAGTDLAIVDTIVADGAVALTSVGAVVMTAGKLLDAGSGTVSIDGTGGVTLANLKTTDTTAGAVTIRATGGAIAQHGGDSIQLAGGAASFTAGSGVGTAGTPIAIAMTGAVDVSATTNSGGIFINGSGGHALGIGGSGLSATTGDITIGNTGGDVVVAPGSGITLSDTTGTLTLKTDTSGAVDIQESIAVAGNIVLDAAGGAGAVLANTGSTTLSAGGAGNSITVTTNSLAGLGPEAGSGRFNTAGTITLTTTGANPGIADLQDIARPTAGGSVTVDHTGAGGLTVSGADYSTRNVDVSLASSGDVTVATAAVDTGSGALAITSGGDITQQAAADLRVGGTLTLTGTDGSKAVTLTNAGNAIGGDITVTTGTLSGSGGTVAITNSLDTTIAASAVKGTLIVSHQGTLTLQGGITADDGFSHVSGSGAGVFLKDTLATTGGAVTFSDAVTLTGAATIDTGTGANIEFADTLDGAFDLTLDAGSGNIDFRDTVGSTTPVGTLTVVAAGDVTAADTVSVGAFVQSAGTGTTTFSKTLATTAATGIDINTNSIDLKGAVSATGGGGITLTNAGALTVADSITADGALLQDGAGAVTLTADITAEAGVQFDGAVSLGSAVTISSGTGTGDITFNGALDGTTHNAEDLTLTAGTGRIGFNGVVGGGIRLGEMTITTAGDVTATAAITASSLKQDSGTGTTTLGDVTLSAVHSGATAGESIEIATGSIALTGMVDTGGHDARFSGGSGDTGLSATGRILTSGGAAVVRGTSVTMVAGARIDSGAGSIDITATAGDARIASLVSTVTAPAAGIRINAAGSVTDANGAGTLNIDMAGGRLDVSTTTGTVELDTDIAELVAATGDAITLREANALDIIDLSLGAGTGTGLIQAAGALTVVDNGNGALAAFRGGNSAMTLESTGGGVVVNDSLTSNTGDLSLIAGGGILQLGADITTAGGSVTTAGGTELTGNTRIATGGGAITLGGDVDAAASATTPALDLQAGAGAVTVGKLGVGKALGAVSVGTTGTVQLGQVEADSLTVAAATTTLTSDINIYAGGLGITGDTILSTSITVDTHNSGDIDFAGAIDGTTNYQEALVLTPGAARSVRIGGAVGAAVPLAGLTITNGVNATVTGALTAGALTVQTVSGSARFADVTLGGGGTTGDVDIKAAAIQVGALDTLAGTSGRIDLVTAGGGSGGIQTGVITGLADVTLDSAVTGGAISTGAVTAGGGGLTIASGGGAITTGALNGMAAGAQTLTITSGAGAVSIGSIGTGTEFGVIDITTNQGTVDVNGAVVLRDTMTVNTSGGAGTTTADPGADVTFHGTVTASNGSASGPTFAVYTGGGGNVEFKADIGNPSSGSPDANSLESVTVVGDRITTKGISTHNGQTFQSLNGTLLNGNNVGNGTLSVEGPLLLTADLVRTGGDVLISGDINYDASVPAGTLFDARITLNSGSRVAIFGRLGGNRDLGSVLIDGAGDNSNAVQVTDGIHAEYNMRIEDVSTVDLGASSVGGFAFIRADDAVTLNGLSVGGDTSLPAGAGILNSNSVMRASDDNSNGVVDFAEYDPDRSLKVYVGDLPGGTALPKNSGVLTFRTVTVGGSGGTGLLAHTTTGTGLTTAGPFYVSGTGSIDGATVSGQAAGAAAEITEFAGGNGSGFLINGCAVGVNCTGTLFVPPPIVVAQPGTGGISITPPAIFEIGTMVSPEFFQTDDVRDLDFSNNGNEEIW